MLQFLCVACGLCGPEKARFANHSSSIKQALTRLPLFAAAAHTRKVTPKLCRNVTPERWHLLSIVTLIGSRLALEVVLHAEAHPPGPSLVLLQHVAAVDVAGVPFGSIGQ